MIKTSFTVTIDDFNKPTFITGVTSIVPNLNGFLLFTEDGKNFQIEAYELEDGGLSNIAFDYFSDEVIEDIKRHRRNTVHDHRLKQYTASIYEGLDRLSISSNQLVMLKQFIVENIEAGQTADIVDNYTGEVVYTR